MAPPTENVVIYDSDTRRRQRTAAAHLRSLGPDLELWVYSADPDLWETSTPTVRTHVAVDINDVRRILEHANSKLRSRPFAVVLDGLMSTGGRPLARLLRCKTVTVLALTSSRQVRGDHRCTRVWTLGKRWRTRGVHKGFCSVEPPAPPPPASAPAPGWVSGWLGFGWLG